MFNSKRDSLNVHRIRTSEGFFLLKDKWNKLLDNSSINTVFLRWEWLWSWWSAYKDKNYDLCILLVFDAEDLIGIAPFYILHHKLWNVFPVRSLLFLGTKEGSVISEYMDIISKIGEEKSVINAIFNYIDEEDICDAICLHKINSSSKSINLFKKISDDMKFLYIIRDMFKIPYVVLPCSFDDFLKSLSSSMRYKIRRNRRRLEKNYKGHIHRIDTISELETHFTELVRLHQKRWESRGLNGAFSEEKFLIFHKMIMKYLFENGYLQLRFLQINNENVACLYNIKYNNKIFFYQSGIDTSFDYSLSPGLLLHSYCIEDAIKEGIKEYDFLLMGNMDSYKKSWTRNYRYMCDIYIPRPRILKFITSFKDKAKNYYHAVKNILKPQLHLSNNGPK